MLYTECKKNEEKILSLWLNEFLKHHGLDTVAVSRTVDDRFLNPAGHIIKAATSSLFKAIMGEEIEQEKILRDMRELLRLQAIQQLSPAQALFPLVAVKEHIYDIVNSLLTTKEAFVQYKEITGRLDTLMLMAFDIFTQDKEDLYRIRIKEVKNAQSQILRFAQAKGFSAERIEAYKKM